MLLQNMDETLDECPTVTLNDVQLRMAKVNELEMGSEFTFTCHAVVIDLQETEGQDGTPEATAVLKLSRISMGGDKEQSEEPAGQQPPVKQVSREKSFYANSVMN